MHISLINAETISYLLSHFLSGTCSGTIEYTYLFHIYNCLYLFRFTAWQADMSPALTHAY